MSTCTRAAARLIIALLLIAVGPAAAYAVPQSSGPDISELAPLDRELLHKALDLVDGGMGEAAMVDLDALAKKYPKNYIVQYERLFALYSLGRYDEVTKAHKQLLKFKDATEQAYQMIGNAYDLTGDRKKAAEIYKEGLKKFPGSGRLYLELGNLSNLDKEYNDALECYNKGIVAEPEFASNYYQAALLYFSSEKGKAWGLVYAETEILLAPSNSSRHQHMAARMVDCLRKSISVQYGDTPTLSVKLVPERVINMNPDTHMMYIGFPGLYEGLLGQPLFRMFMAKEPFTASLPQLMELRRGAVEAYCSVTGNIYGNSMYLLEFQKKVIDAGHWEAYNYYILGPAYDDDVFDTWYDAHEDEFDAFIEWYNADPFSLGDGRSVDPSQIYTHYRPVDMMEGLTIQAELMIDTKKLSGDTDDDADDTGDDEEND